MILAVGGFLFQQNISKLLHCTGTVLRTGYWFGSIFDQISYCALFSPFFFRLPTFVSENTKTYSCTNLIKININTLHPLQVLVGVDSQVLSEETQQTESQPGSAS